MPFVRPTISTLISRISDDLNTWLPGEDSRIRRSMLWAMARMVAGAVHPIYGFVEWLGDQIFADTAEAAYLHRIAALFGLTPGAAVQSTSTNAQWLGTNGTVLPAGAVFSRADGVQYTVDAPGGTVAGGAVNVACTAVLAGVAGNADALTIVSLDVPIAGLNTDGVFVVAASAGTDDEDDESLLDRLLDRLRTPPQGGAVADYVAWVKAALPGLAESVWPQYLSAYPAVPEGDVDVYFSMLWDGSDPASVIPSAGNVTTVQAYLEAVIPVTVNVLTAIAPSADVIPLTIALTSDTAAARAAVTAQINDLFQRRAAPGGSIIENSEFRAAIARGAVDEQFDLTDLDGDGTGNSDYTQGATTLAHLGTITWV